MFHITFSPNNIHVEEGQWPYLSSRIGADRWEYGGDAEYSYVTATREEANIAILKRMKKQIDMYKKFCQDNDLQAIS